MIKGIVEDSGFVWGKRSKQTLVGSHPDLEDVLTLALKKTVVDMAAYDGGRNEAEQREHVRNGKSDTMNSSHRYDSNKIFYACDIVPWINGTTSWKPEDYHRLMRSVFYAGHKLCVPLDWGGWWTGTSFGPDMPHVGLDKRFYPPGGAVSTYRSRHRAGYRWLVNVKTGKYESTKYYHNRQV